MLKKLLNIISVLGLLLISASYANAQPEVNITVSAAISLKNAFEEIAKLYEQRYPATKVMFNFGASGDLAAQIEGGAPVDVFASAAQKDMDLIAGKKLVDNTTRRDFVRNTVVLVKPVSSKLDIKGFEDLAKPDIRMLAIGNPKTVPAGRYAQEVLQTLKLWDKVKSRLILAENVRQVLDYVAKNEVDAGLVYATDASVRAADVSVIAKAPENSHKPVVYPIAMVSGSSHPTQAKAFIEMILSNDGMRILQKYGFESTR